jgi:hypothetical protein
VANVSFYWPGKPTRLLIEKLSIQSDVGQAQNNFELSEFASPVKRAHDEAWVWTWVLGLAWV